jgi:predicted membrane protein
MQTSDNDFKEDLKQRIRGRRDHSGHALAGLVLVGIGAVLLAEQFGVFIPSWVISWKMLLIAIGVFIGARNSFRSVGWIFPVVVGAAFLVDDLLPALSFRQYIWPILIIGLGLLMIVRPKRRKNDYWKSWQSYSSSSATDAGGASEDTVDSIAAFSAIKKNIISKDFKGGQLTSFCGGNDLNLMQADFNGTVTLEITNVFGGSKLFVPPHWNIKSEVVCVFGGVDDKRPYIKESVDATKALRLIGTCVFGGIEIKSHLPH